MVSAHSTPPTTSQDSNAQLAEQVPLEQNCPLGHAFAQLPQFCGSLTTVLQTPPHSAWPAPH